MCGGVHPQRGTWHQHTILSNSPENCMKSMVYALNIFFSKVTAAKILHKTSSRMSVVDLRGALLVHAPLRTKIFSISCSFSENLVKIICWCPRLEGWCPLLWKSWICPWMCTTHPLAIITRLGEVVVVVRSDPEGGW